MQVIGCQDGASLARDVLQPLHIQPAKYDEQ
jgi:hypothetical protein